MCQPLPIARADLVAHLAAAQIAEFQIEARVPLSLPLDVLAFQIAHFLDRVQKQVGQTIVQFVHDRHRSATSFQREWSRLFSSRSRMPSVSSRLVDLIDGLLPGVGRLFQSRRQQPIGRQFGEQFAAGLAADIDSESVVQFRHRQIEAASASGPVSIDVQKQVLAAWVQLTATMNAPSRRLR